MTGLQHEVWRRYYVTVRDAGRTGFLLGPYSTHDEARMNVGRARDLARKHDDRAAFYAFGTASTPKARRTVFGR